MVNVGILGDVSVGKTTILRLFVKFVEDKSLESEFNLPPTQIVKTDFSGEATLPSKEDIKQTKTIHPNRVVFRIGDHMHTLFAPGGDDRPLVRMGIVTVSRIARVIVAVFDMSRDLESQFEFYTAVRFIPKTIIVALNKADLVPVKELKKKVEEFSDSITEYFKEKRKIDVAAVFVTVAEPIEGYETNNIECAKLILECLKDDVSEPIAPADQA
jgi:translation elongation factor EF-Tu-like GTPase